MCPSWAHAPSATGLFYIILRYQQIHIGYSVSGTQKFESPQWATRCMPRC
ncbi:hypothetical protein CsSME_00047703 [Camellia sinensis var. sinensis]